MLSLQLVSEIQAGASVVTPFQPYWDILIDYCLTGFLMTVLFGLAGVTLTGTTEIACIPIENGTELTDISISLFVNSRCSRIFGGRFLLYYPYIALVAYLVMLFGHLLSVKLPATSSFLNVMFQLFADFKTLKSSSAYFGGGAPVTSPEEQRDKNEARKGGTRYKILRLEVKEKVIALVERLMFALYYSSNFCVVYVAKSLILFFGSGVIIAGNVTTLVLFDWSLVFECDLTSYVASVYEVTSCTIPAAPFLYGLMIISSVFAFFVLVLTFRAVAWLYQTRNFREKYLRPWKKSKHVLADLPGFDDFCFCLMLMRENGTDGETVYRTVNSSLKIYNSLKIEEQFDKDQLLSTTVASDVQFEMDNYICDFMLSEMGMRGKELSGVAPGVINTLANVGEALGMDVDTKDECKKVRKLIFDELVYHPTRYKDLIDDSSHNLPSFREYVKSIKNGSFFSGEVCECYYVLMAFANCSRAQLVLLRPHRSSFVFTPLDSGGEPPKVVFVKHVPPSDYVSVTLSDDASPEQCSARDQFLHDEQYSKLLRTRADESWLATGYPSFLKTLKARLPKYLTGTSDALDKTDGSIGGSPVKPHVAYLEELGLGEKQDNGKETEP